MRTIISFFLVIVLTSFSQAQQFPGEIFHRGQVTLNDGTELKGQIKYDLNVDVILLIQNGQKNVTTLSASQFQSFSIDNRNNKSLRRFYAVPVVNETGYRRPKIFELIYEGPTSLIAREFIATRSRTSSRSSYRRSIYDPFYTPGSNMVTYRYLAYDLWIINDEAELSELGNTRGDVVKSFEKHHSELRKFIKKERLKMDKLQDISRLVEYYNQLESL